MISYNPQTASKADNFFSYINETGKYTGIITRAEILKSAKGTSGVGLSFKDDSGATAEYLDVYTINAEGKELQGLGVIHAIIGCLRLNQVSDGQIKCTKYNKETKSREEMIVPGYPELMNKRIGFLLQKEISTRQDTGEDIEKMVIVGVFQPDTELTVSEINQGKTKGEVLSRLVSALAAKPIRDTRKHKPEQTQAARHEFAATGGAFDDLDSDLPF